MVDRIESLERRLADLENRVETISRSSRRRLVAAVLTAGLAITWASTPAARAQFGLTLTGLNTRLVAVEAKTAPLSVRGTDFFISGMNIHIVDGTGFTNSTSGLGNLTVGYNETSIYGADKRTGSHNLILGVYNNYTSYGGLVVGVNNTISGPFATVTGGFGNTASGGDSSVGGGESNTASGSSSTVSGGADNIASGDNSSVSGGLFNTAIGRWSSVSGGLRRSAPTDFNWTAGGLFQPQ